MEIAMEKILQTKGKRRKGTDPNLFFKIKIKTIKEDLLLSLLSGSELKVLLAISAFINNENNAYPSQKYISRLTNLSVSTVSRVVNTLSSKKFTGEKVLSINKEKESGKRFSNNRYKLSPKLGISFGSEDHSPKTHKSVKHVDQTNNTNTLDKNQILKNNHKVISSKKKAEHTSSRISHILELSTREEEDTFQFYAKLISEDKHFDGDIEHAQRVLLKNIEAMGLENWKDLTKILQNHPNPKAVLNHIRYCVSQLKLTYKEAWKEWDSKY